jgi:hypothetical protein
LICDKLRPPNDNSTQESVITGEQGFGFLAGPQSDAIYQSPFPAQLVPTTKKGEYACH